jgi:hypothetical protein
MTSHSVGCLGRVPFLLALGFIFIAPVVMAADAPRTVGCEPNFPDTPCPQAVPESGLGLLLPAAALLLLRRKQSAGL